MKTFQFKILVLIIISTLSILRVWKERKTYPSGDAIEYVWMTEAFYNHFSPEIKSTDCESFKNAFSKVNRWNKNEKATQFDKVQNFIETENHHLLNNENNFFIDKEGNKFSCHFWFYSLLNLPVRYICALFPFNPFVVFYITNIILIVISCFIFLKTSPFSNFFTGAFCLLFFFSTNLWYLNWTHPEVFSTCFVAVGLWIFLLKKPYIGILLISIAALQNQPLVILSSTLSLVTILNYGFKFKNIFLIVLSSVPNFIPPLFYYYHFGVTNLINYVGALDIHFVTFTRVFGFFFDLNQGMIIAFPLILLIYLLLYILKIFRKSEWKSKLDLLLLPAMILMICAASTINNWNSGQAVVSRYVCYIGAVLLVHFFFLVMELFSERNKIILLSASLLIQIPGVIYLQKITCFDLHTCVPKPFSNWVLTHFPSFYNPDPVIFITRYNFGMDRSLAESPAIFKKQDGEITKFMVHRKYINNLERYGITKSQIDSLTPLLHFINDWAYIDAKGNFRPNIYTRKLRAYQIEEKINQQIKGIKSIPEWYAIIKQKAKANDVSEDEVLRKDAIYVLKLNIDFDKESAKEERIKTIIKQMKSNSDWLKKLNDKAEKLHLPLDSIMYSDAKWIVESDVN